MILHQCDLILSLSKNTQFKIESASQLLYHSDGTMNILVLTRKICKDLIDSSNQLKNIKRLIKGIHVESTDTYHAKLVKNVIDSCNVIQKLLNKRDLIGKHDCSRVAPVFNHMNRSLNILRDDCSDAVTLRGAEE